MTFQDSVPFKILTTMKYSTLKRTLAVIAAGFTLAISAQQANAQAQIALTADVSTDFGDVIEAGSVSSPETFTITNDGDELLTITSRSITGDFAFVTFPAGTVAAGGGTTQFTVRFNPTQLNARSGTLTVRSAIANRALTLTGAGTRVNISVNNSEESIDYDLSDVDLGITPNVLTTRDLTIRNNGNRTLNISSVTASGSDFTILSSPTTVAASGSETLRVQFNPSSRGSKTETVTITSNAESPKNVFTFTVTGVATAPEIEVSQSVLVNSGGDILFGDVSFEGSKTLEVTIRNTGNTPLTGLVVSGLGSEFSLASPPAGTLTATGTAGDSTTFRLQFEPVRANPTDTGVRSTTISISNNDPDGAESPFRLTLSGRGVDVPSSSDAFGYTVEEIQANTIELLATDIDVFKPADLNLQLDQSKSINIGFDFMFYDNVYSSLDASTSGLISFGNQPNAADYTPSNLIPTTADTDNFIAAYWTDLDPRAGGATGEILYATRGTAPNRVFIIHYKNMPEYGNTAAKLSFQVVLHEGTGTIEVHYKNRDATFNTANSISGIENADGTIGIDITNNAQTALRDVFGNIQALRYSRPAIVTVESEAVNPLAGILTNVGNNNSSDVNTENDLNPENGIVEPKPQFGDSIDFEAPEYIYFNSSFTELSELDDTAWYRLVNDGYSVEAGGIELERGDKSNFTFKLDSDIKVVWNWRLEYAVVVESATDVPGFASPDPGGFGSPVSRWGSNDEEGIGRVWVSRDAQFTAEIDSDVKNGAAGLAHTIRGYQVYNTDGSPRGGLEERFPDDVRAVTDVITVSQPLRIRWEWEGSVRYIFDAASGQPGVNETEFQSMAFLRYYQADGVSPVVNQQGGNISGYILNSQTNQEVWIPVGRKVEIGAFYRTDDRRYTLGDFPVPLGGDVIDIGNDITKFADDIITITLPAGTTPRVARVRTVALSGTPTDIHWFYKPTVFRAIVPLGQGIARGNGEQFTPNLPGDAKLGLAGPLETSLLNVISPPVPAQATAAPWRWDRVGEVLYPVHPGSNRIDWPDTDPDNGFYKIEVVSGYPGDSTDPEATATLVSALEDDAGMRKYYNTTSGKLPNTHPRYDSEGVEIANVFYEFTSYLGEAGSEFPGYPRAHYRHLNLAPEGLEERQPPTKLDLNSADEWKFLEMTYRDHADTKVDTASPGVLYDTPADAKRSVFLYSRRPNREEIATGDLSREVLAVRVVESFTDASYPIAPTDSRHVLRQRGLEFGNSIDDLGIMGSVSNIDHTNSFVVDFWLNASEFLGDAAPVQVLRTGDGKFDVTVDNHLVDATAAVTAGAIAGTESIDVPFAFETSADLNVANITTGTVLAPGGDFTATPGAPSGTLTLSGNAVTETVPNDGSWSIPLPFGVASAEELELTAGTQVLTSPEDFALDLVSGTLEFVPTTMTVVVSSPSQIIPLDMPKLPLSAAVDFTVTGMTTGTFTYDLTNHRINLDSATIGDTITITKDNAYVAEGDSVIIKRLQSAVTAGDELRITRNNASGGSSTITATYLGMPVSHTLYRGGSGWRHYAIHVFEKNAVGVSNTEIDFYVDGLRKEESRVTSQLDAVAPANGTLQLGVGAESNSGLLFDQFRLFTNLTAGPTPRKQLDSGELRTLRTTQATLRTRAPQLLFDFEVAPTSGSFANLGSLGSVGLGPVSGDLDNDFADLWVRVALQEVAMRLDSTLDNAGFGGGYIVNRLSNYNANIYNRGAEVGTWGPIFPVNQTAPHYELGSKKELEVAYYENPYRLDRRIHPNVAWPYITSEYNEVTYPNYGPDVNKAIYIASRIGTEGVDRAGYPQQVFDLAQYENLAIYNQDSKEAPGYNPNEEHALVAASGRAALKVKNAGAGIPNNPPLAAFALQNNINTTAVGTSYTSDPWVLVQVDNLATGEPEMAAYQVFKTRNGTSPNTVPANATLIPFPRPFDQIDIDNGNAPIGAQVIESISGLDYESADKREDRFLTMDPDGQYNFAYKFEYPVMAGDLLIPPYPVNVAVGNLTMVDDYGGNIQVTRGTEQINQRTLWRDAGGFAWIVSGEGKFFHQFFYPRRGDFYMRSSDNAAIGDPIAWLPSGTGFKGNTVRDNDPTNPVRVIYTSKWRSDYPKLKRGETLTYQGGEYFNENPGSKGLPALVAMAAAEIVYDPSTPSMIIADTTKAALDVASARIIRPLDRREVPFTVSAMASAGFKPGDDKTAIVAERWYFRQLAGSLSTRFYFDSLAEKLVFRGYLNDKDSGASDLTAGPDPLNILEPNVMTKGEYETIKVLGAGGFPDKVAELFLLSQNPNEVTAVGLQASTTAPVFLQGVKDAPLEGPQKAVLDQLRTFWVQQGNDFIASLLDVPLVQLDSFGVGAALVPNPKLLTEAPTGSKYITIAENNRPELAAAGAPVSLHIIEIIPDRYRGAIKVIEPADPFSEKVDLQHNGEFGSNTGDLYYEWWVRDAAPLDLVADEVLPSGALAETAAGGAAAWQKYEEGRGLHKVTFAGRPDVVLSDKLVLMRYRHYTETNGWKLVPFEVADPVVDWQPGSSTVAAPFQWAGAANSPQLQADGSKRYIPQLVMGWVKRVLDRINPYEARYTDFFSNESPATYSSQIQIAGAPYAGQVALNPDKNVVENVGLIELYETVLNRARSLSIDNSSNGNATDGVNQALLLAATRLSVLYELLAREAYGDAQDPTINAGANGALTGVASYTHAFQNMEADLMNEELSLLRGTDFRKSFPVYNRMFWNYAKGLGEAAYNVNYNIYDENANGFINEDDARALYPQGHGDSWGHYLSAIKMPYTLLQHPGFSWKTRSELYSLMQNVLEVDFLDETTFARLAAGRARAGRDIVRGTYRLAYTQDPDGQWQGYTDSADKARAWGVSEWGHRAGQAAYFDWAVANALLPDEAAGAAPIDNPENLDHLDRLAAEDQIGEITGALHEIQIALDEANSGVNPLGFDTDALAFDIDPKALDGGAGGRKTQFEQVYERALVASRNAMATLDYATRADNKLRDIGNDTNAKIAEAFEQDLNYRNRLIEIFGRPYDGTVGFGKAYPEGYEGPDLMLYMYLDRTTVSQIIPHGGMDSNGDRIPYTDIAESIDFLNIKGTIPKPGDMEGFFKSSTTSDATIAITGGSFAAIGVLANGGLYDNTTELDEAYKTYISGNTYTDPTVTLYGMPIRRASHYAFQSDGAWGQRTSYGKLQRTLEQMLAEEIALKSALDDYAGFLGDFETMVLQLEHTLEIMRLKGNFEDAIIAVRVVLAAARAIYDSAVQFLELGNSAAETTTDIVLSALPDSLVAGFSNGGDLTFAGSAAVNTTKAAVVVVSDTAKAIAETVFRVADLAASEAISAMQREQGRLDASNDILGMLAGIEQHTGDNGPKLASIGSHLQNLSMLRQAYITAQAEGFRLLKERESFNTGLAAAVQSNRYNDMIFRLSRNEAMAKYQSSFNHAARYAWLAARAYDYETSLDPGHPAAPGQLQDRIVKERQLGLWSGGQPQVGQGGLAEILSQLNANFQVLKGQLGLNNPQSEVEKISLRGELFRISPGIEALDPALVTKTVGDRSAEEQQLYSNAAASDARWQDAIKARIVPDLTNMPEFKRYCRPFSDPEDGPQPGIVIRFSSHIHNGVNFFGKSLAPGDHAYSSANFATKISGHGVWLDNYDAAELATTPRAYLVPAGDDYLRTSSSAQPVVRRWGVVEQRIPTPFTINQTSLSSPGYIPTLDGLDGSFAELRRHGDFRVYHGIPGADGTVNDGELIYDSRLVSRSVWNSDWLLIIPGANLHADPEKGLQQLADKVSDIKIHFKTYSHQGQ
jgi:hypothetical protein